MSNLRPGDILLFRRGSFIAKIIQWGTNSKYSHVAVCVDTGKNLLIEAQGSVRANDTRKMKDYDIFRVKVDYVYDLDGMISFLVDKLNNKYDYLGVVFLGILKLLRLKPVANKWQKDKDYFCSELCYAAFAFGGNLDIVPDVPEADITSPADIAESKVVERIERG